MSDVYVRLGYEFNLACRAFGAIGMDTSDLGPVPDLLRTILEDTLSQDASTESLERFLPRIRDIIINLLRGLKRKQAKLRSRQAKEGRAAPARQGSSGSVEFNEIGGQQILDENAIFPQSPQKQPVPQRQGTPYDDDQSTGTNRNTVSTWSSDRRNGSFSEREAMRQEEPPKSVPLSTSSSSMSSFTMQHMPILAPHSETGTASSNTESPSHPAVAFPHPPPPPPKQNDAIGLLQRSGELERRASRRFSAYHIQKHLGASPNGVPVIPSSQSSSIPNRGRDVRESMNAVRLRGSHVHRRQKSKNRYSQSLSNINAHTTGDLRSQLKIEPPELSGESSSPMAKTPTDKLRSPRDFESRDVPIVGALPGLPPVAERDSLPEGRESVAEYTPAPVEVPARADQDAESNVVPTLPDSASRFTPEQSPTPPNKEITLFLQYKSKIKKYVFSDGYGDLTIARLQLAFIEKFAWNTHNNGADLPEIYIQDPVSGVRHELEDLSDVKDRSVLVLNVEVLDEVKKHFDESVGGLRHLVEGVRGVMDGQNTSIQRLVDRQQETAKEIARLAAGPAQAVSPLAMKSDDALLSQPLINGGNGLGELQSLRRDLAVLRQTYSNFTSDISTSMNTVREKASAVKSTATDFVIPSYEGDAGRARVNSGKKELADESEKLVARVDDLQDLVEDLRKDVVTRGVRPLPRQLEAVGRDISAVTKELKKMQDFLKREKPIWTKIWEKELQLVCEERDQLTMQEDLAVDLEDDLEKATQTFALVEQATKEQSLDASSGTSAGVRNASRSLPIEQAADPMKAKDTLLGEVRALQPNHENRLEAIERAEKSRQKELEDRRDDVFQKELHNFVSDGKLKKSGGVEEAERARKEKDDRIRKEVWERMQGIVSGADTSVNEAPEDPAAPGNQDVAVPAETTAETNSETTEGGPKPEDNETRERDTRSPSAEAPGM